MRMRHLSPYLFTFVLIFQNLPAQGEELMLQEVMGSGAKSMLVLKPVVTTPYAGSEKDQQELYDLLIFDLQFADSFSVLTETPQAQFLANQDEQQGFVNYAEWKNLRVNERLVDFVVKTKLVPRGPGQFQLDLLVYNIAQEERVIGQAYGATPRPPFTRADLRRAGHKATADIISTLTGDVPITETKIAFVNFKPASKTKEIFVIDYDGWQGSLKQVTFFNNITIFPDWAPNGDELAYVSYKDKWPDAFIQTSSGLVTKLAKFMGINTTPRWFPDGQNLAISLSAEGNPEIYKIHRSGKNQVRLTHNNARDISPDVSPDGSRIAFTSDRWGDVPKIFTMNADGSNQQRLTFDERKADTPFWSPVPISTSFGGTAVKEAYRIAYTGYFGSGQSDIFTVFSDGSDPQNLTGKIARGGISQNPSWSPNGKYIAFSSNFEGKTDIYLMSAAGGTLPNGKSYHRVTRLGGENSTPSWSPK